MSLTMDDPKVQELYRSVDALLWERSIAYVKRYRIGNVDDAKSDANESFMIAVRNWDPSKGMKFSSWVRRVVQNRFLDHARRFAIKYTRQPVVDTTELEIEDERTGNPWYMKDLSHDAMDLHELCTAREYRPFQTKMKRALSPIAFLHSFLRENWNWSPQRIAEATEEMREALSLN